MGNLHTILKEGTHWSREVSHHHGCQAAGLVRFFSRLVLSGDEQHGNGLGWIGDGRHTSDLKCVL